MASLQQHAPSLLIAAALATIWLVYSLISKIQLERRRAVFKAQHGCQEPRRLRRWDLFGFYGLYMLLTAAKEHRLLDYWSNNFKLYGNTHRGVRRGRQFITTKDAENFKSIHATNFDDWAVEDTRSAFHYFLGKGVFTTDGAFWSHSRAVLRPQFEKQQVAELAQFEPHVQNLFLNIPVDGTTVDLQDLFHKFAMDTSSEFLSGISTGILAGGDNSKGVEFSRAFERSTHDCALRARAGWIYWLLPHSGGPDAVKICRAYAENWVNTAMKRQGSATEKTTSDKRQYVFLHQLLQDERLDANRIRDEMLNIMLAGRDTTASTLSSLFWELSRKPDILAKLRAEVDQLHGEVPTYEQLRDMKYVKYCVSETLRVYPPVPALVKTAIRDTVLPRGGGVDGKHPLFVRKSDLIFYNHRAMMRSPEIYGPDAEEFRPERWADASFRPGWNYLPFGGGARTCLGQQYALTEAYYVTIRMLQEYSKIESRDNGPWRESLSVTLCSLDGTKVALYK